MVEKISLLKQEFQSEISQASTSNDLEALKVKYLGKKGPIQELMKLLKDVSPEERPLLGKSINELKEHLTQELSDKMARLLEKEIALKLVQEDIDITLPGRRRFAGRKHILTQTMEHVIQILIGMGFSVQYGPDIDTE